ncbi:MAG: YceH family protein [Actinobacteria bacterium]|nr:YceH family protein [Actinomycetota bacterium]
MTLGLDPVEVRVLGCLIEKGRATPQNYPLTLNSLRLACNQTTNRFPISDYDEYTLDGCVAGLKERGLLRFVYSTSNRATKYRHVLDEALGLADDELAVICVLFLRGPQTAGEIKGRTDRLHSFGDLGDVQATLDRLSSLDQPLVLRLDKQPGQKDARYLHLLGDAPVAELALAGSPAIHPSRAEPARVADPRLDELEAEVAELRELVEQLRGDVDALRVELGG